MVSKQILMNPIFIKWVGLKQILKQNLHHTDLKPQDAEGDDHHHITWSSKLTTPNDLRGWMKSRSRLRDWMMPISQIMIESLSTKKSNEQDHDRKESIGETD